MAWYNDPANGSVFRATGETMTGLWSHPGVPHKGWRCVGVADLRPPEGGEYEPETCQMCLNEKLRFVHTREHDDYPDQVDAG